MMEPKQVEQADVLVSDPTGRALARHILDFDPKIPTGRVFTSAAIMKASGVPGILAQKARLAPSEVVAAAVPVLSPIPSPTGFAPVAPVLNPPPASADPLLAADVHLGLPM